ncbi:AbiH family protein [Acinetobacter sichuanensis]|uniref:AbiH family protein n=1 Tax=Acinetobacter sichuanensis TaxID=2136183 RepID=UPI00280C7932|nr:AbiH family protein [Acinetobacter sichuanensis]MDQ9020605.1 AbiH family protein [Acinetobacter sichuanensis]
MNILIVGNGFDLSHYLPTKYDHFMDVMKAIEEKDTGEKPKDLSIHSVDKWMENIDKIFEKRKGQSDPNYGMNFDELFSKTRESYFIEKTKEFYLTENITLSAKDVLKLQYRLKLNSWYQYFKNHVEEIKTWIDFEQKIESALILVVKVVKKIHLKFEKYGKIDTTIRNLTNTNSDKEDEKIYISELDMNLLIKLDLFLINNDYGKVTTSAFGRMSDSRKGFINNNWFYVKDKAEYGFSIEKYVFFLNSQLEEFIEIFNLYLELIVSQLSPIETFSVVSQDWSYPNKIFSFNYTNTYQRIHDSVEVEYLHGSHGEEQNIVLGVSDLEDESLKKIKAYGFTKYHQKLFKDTDYLFLDEYKNNILKNTKDFSGLNNQLKNENQPAYRNHIKKLMANLKMTLDLNFYIWGHSLDVSDQDYIKDLFSLNDDMDRNVRVIVYYFNKTAKFDLLNNLLAILGKDKVEHWMKNKWLQFKENPKIVPESAITLEDLPQT